MSDELRTAKEIAYEWYQVDLIHLALRRGADEQIPSDHKSMEFAEWLTDQYRLAMMKGMQLCPRCKRTSQET